MSTKDEAVIVTKRFLQVMEVIISARLQGVAGIADFAGRLSFAHNNFPGMQRGQRYVTVAVMHRLCSIFKVSPSWLLLGEGDMFSSGVELIDTVSVRLRKLEERMEKMEILSQPATPPKAAPVTRRPRASA